MSRLQDRYTLNFWRHELVKFLQFHMRGIEIVNIESKDGYKPHVLVNTCRLMMEEEETMVPIVNNAQKPSLAQALEAARARREARNG